MSRLTAYNEIAKFMNKDARGGGVGSGKAIGWVFIHYWVVDGDGKQLWNYTKATCSLYFKYTSLRYVSLIILPYPSDSRIGIYSIRKAQSSHLKANVEDNLKVAANYANLL